MLEAPEGNSVNLAMFRAAMILLKLYMSLAMFCKQLLSFRSFVQRQEHFLKVFCVLVEGGLQNHKQLKV